MKLLPDQLYHIYNQGNNQEITFLERKDYLLFLSKYRTLVTPYCDTIAYCLMPNHFHFLINTSANSVVRTKLGGIEIDQITNAFRRLLSEYARDFNIKYDRTGSLFRQKTKGKQLEEYAFTCFHYIHQNPYRAELVKKMEDWEFSSFRDYARFRNGTLCRQDVAIQLIEIDVNDFYEQSYQVIPSDFIDKFY